MTEITVIGCGVAGLCVATELVRRGASVILKDQAAPPSDASCSWWAGGMLAPWCEGESAEEPVIRLGQEAFDWWDRNTGLVTRNGSLVVALGRDRAELSRFARRTSDFKEVTPKEIAILEPDLENRVTGGLYFQREGHLTPRSALKTLFDQLIQNGARFEQGRATPKGLTIDCRGLAAKDALPDLRGVKGEMMVLHSPEIALHRPIRLLHPRIPLYIVPRGDGLFMLGATMLETGSRSRATARSVMELLNAAYALNPLFGEAEIVEIGVDARPAFPDNLPRIRRSGDVIFVNGLYRHGFLLAPSLARMVADLIFDGVKPEVCDDHAYA